MADAMDSKSISREGVGVQVPASAPTTTTDLDPFVQAALPVLVHRLNNSAQVVAGVNALLALDPRADVLAARASDLAEVAREYADTGWLIGMCAMALGEHERFERRDARGLELATGLAIELARRAQRTLAVEGSAPALRHAHGAGWEGAWTLGSWLHAAALAAPAGARVRVVCEAHARGMRWRDDAPWTSERERCARRLGSRVADLDVEAGTRALELGARWFSAPQSSAAPDVPT